MAITLPWHLTMLILNSKTFIDRYFTYNLLIRSIVGSDDNVGTSMYYYDCIKVAFNPWFSLIPFAFVNNLSDYLHFNLRKKPPVLLFLIIIVFGLYSLLIQTKLPWYILPVFPAICILISYMIIEAFDSPYSFAFSSLIFSLFIAIILAANLLSTTMIRDRKEIIYAALIIASTSIIILICSFFIKRTNYKYFFNKFISKLIPSVLTDKSSTTELAILNKDGSRILFRKTIVVIITILIIGSWMTRSVHQYAYIYSPIAEISKMAKKTSHNIPLIASDDMQTVLFYTNRPIIDIDDPEKVSSYQGINDGQEIIITASDLESLKSVYEFKVLAEIPPYVYATIQRR